MSKAPVSPATRSGALDGDSQSYPARTLIFLGPTDPPDGPQPEWTVLPDPHQPDRMLAMLPGDMVNVDEQPYLRLLCQVRGDETDASGCTLDLGEAEELVALLSRVEGELNGHALSRWPIGTVDPTAMAVR